MAGNAFDDGKQTTYETTVRAHGTTDLKVVYTNEVWKVEEMLEEFEKELDDLGVDRYMGLDLEYTSSRRTGKVAVVQLALGTKVLVYHYCKASQNYSQKEALSDFLKEKSITFASVDITQDTVKLRKEGMSIPDEFHVDIQRLYKIEGYGDKAGMGALAAKIIDKSYAQMKGKCTNKMHQEWDRKPLSDAHVEYAAIDAFVSYDMYRRILDMREGLGLGKPVLNDKLCVQCKSGLMYKAYKLHQKRVREEGRSNSWDDTWLSSEKYYMEQAAKMTWE